MTNTSRNVLFLCTGNSARSVLAEAYLNTIAKGQFHAFSAGSHPKGAVHPLTLETLRAADIATGDFRSKSWDEFAQPGAPRMDFVFTVCDSAAAEPCPIWPGQPMSAHWGVPDPAAAQGGDEDKRRAFRNAFTALTRRIDLFLALPDDKLNKRTLAEIGRG